MFFGSLHDKLISHIREKVRAGELSERELARLTGVSQPHMHNVLKGARSLSTEYADQILSHLHLSLLDLISATDMAAVKTTKERGAGIDVPWLRGTVGPFKALEQTANAESFGDVTQTILRGLTEPVIVTLGHDPALFPHFQDGDLALVTRYIVSPESLEDSAYYVVRTGAVTLVRSVRLGGARLYLVTPETRDEPRKWDSLTLRGLRLENLILGKITWIGRRLTKPTVPPAIPTD